MTKCASNPLKILNCEFSSFPQQLGKGRFAVLSQLCVYLTKTFLAFIAFKGPGKKQSTSKIVVACISVSACVGVAILIAIAVFCWRRYRGFYVTLRYLTKCRRYSNLLRRLLSLSAGNDVMKISIFPLVVNQGRLPFTSSIRVEILVVNIQCSSLSKRKLEKSEDVVVSIGKFKRKRQNAAIKPIAYNF